MSTTIEKNNCKQNWHVSKVDRFWNEIALHDSVYNMYDEEEVFINLLAGFVGTGINADNCNIVIASKAHLEKLAEKLRLHGIYVSGLIDDERYYPIDAQQMLNMLMENGMPSEELFTDIVSKIVRRARKKNRKVRTYREMAPMLKVAGNSPASVRLEKLWGNYKDKEVLCLFCAYPNLNVTNDECSFFKMQGIENPKIVREAVSAAEILYRNCQ